MILQMKQTTKFWKIGMGTFNNYLLCVCFMGNDYKKQTKQTKQTNLYFFFFFFLYKLRLDCRNFFIVYSMKYKNTLSTSIALR